jgi:hypothetical protein
MPWRRYLIGLGQVARIEVSHDAFRSFERLPALGFFGERGYDRLR